MANLGLVELIIIVLSCGSIAALVILGAVVVAAPRRRR